MHLVRPLQRGDRRLAQADVADLAFADQIRHRAHDVFDRHLRIDPVLIIKIDLLHAQAPQAALDGAPDILGAAADAARRRIRRIAQDAELGGQEHLLPFAFDRFPHQRFVGVRAIHVGGVEQRDAQLQRPVQRDDGFLPIGAGGVEVAHAHASQPQGGDDGTVGTQFTLLHCAALMR